MIIHNPLFKFRKKRISDKKITNYIGAIEEKINNRLGKAIDELKCNFAIKKKILLITIGGSTGRGEGEIKFIKNKIQLSDIDLFIITKNYNPLLNNHVKKIILKHLRGIDVKVSIGLIPIKSLEENKSIMMYELKSHQYNLYGEEKILEKIHINSPNEIPKIEGIRIILNRAIELLNAIKIKEQKIHPQNNFYYAYSKAILACGLLNNLVVQDATLHIG